MSERLTRSRIAIIAVSAALLLAAVYFFVAPAIYRQPQYRIIRIEGIITSDQYLVYDVQSFYRGSDHLVITFHGETEYEEGHTYTIMFKPKFLRPYHWEVIWMKEEGAFSGFLMLPPEALT